MATDTHNLLWTGGWDSTFRLLELIFLHKHSVSPHYIIDASRKSLNFELQAISKILTELEKKHPIQRQLIQPLHLVMLDDISIDEEQTKAFNHYKTKYGKLGKQYLWLGAYSKQYHHLNLEISDHKRIRPENSTLAQLLIENSEEIERKHRAISSDHPDLQFIHTLRFPLLDKTKHDMGQIAKMNGFMDILEKSWFCHNPIKGKPCAVCKPCSVLFDEKMQQRIPLHRKLMRPIMRLKREKPLRHLKKSIRKKFS